MNIFYKETSTIAESFRRRKLLCFRNFRVSKKSIPKWGISRTSMENLLSHSTEIFRRATYQCVTKFGNQKLSA